MNMQIVTNGFYRGAGPALLCVSENSALAERFAAELDSMLPNWKALPLSVEEKGAYIADK